MVVTLRLSLNYRNLLFLHLSECKFRHTMQVYTFKPIFKKIGQAKALDLSYVFPGIFTLLPSNLNGESEKQTHLCRTVELSDYRAVEVSDCRTNGLSDYS